MAAKKKAKAKAKSKPATKKPVTKKLAVKKTAPVKAAKKSAATNTATTTRSTTNTVSTAKRLGNLSEVITPLDDRLIVQPEGVSEKTAGGLFIPGTVNERPNKGTVLAKGRGRRNKKGQLRPLDVSVGDEVLFPEYSGTRITVQGADLLIMREEDILGIVT